MKNKRNLISAIITCALFLTFAVFTVIVKKVGVEQIGPENTAVGLAALNGAVASFIGFNADLYDLTQCLGIFALFIAGCFCVFFLVQLLSRRGFKNVDKDLYALMAAYIFAAVLYVAFEKVIINYRPVIIGREPEASYPSTHTVLGLTVFVTAALQLKTRIKGRGLSLAAFIALIAFAALTVAGRLFSGVHWFTDIIAGVILSAAIVAGYVTVSGWRTSAGKTSGKPEDRLTECNSV